MWRDPTTRFGDQSSVKNAEWPDRSAEFGELGPVILPGFGVGERFFLQNRIGGFRRIKNSDSLLRAQFEAAEG
jgi:hypothetical protein